MGTRSLTAVIDKEGELKVAQYGQWDGYPSGQGTTILAFLQKENSLKNLESKLKLCRFLDEERDKEFTEAYNKNAPKWSNEPDNRTEEQKRWFSAYMTRDLGGEILESIANSNDKEILLSNSVSFAEDSLMCEYAYVVDFSKNKFEVFEGFNKNPLDKTERFYNEKHEETKPEYYPVGEIASFDLDKLPSEQEFLAACKTEDEE